MVGKILLVAMLAFTLGSTFAADEESATVTVKGKLQEDKFGFFIQANGATYDLIVADNAKADMHKFHGEIKDDYVQVSGPLFVDNQDKAKPRLTVYANDVTHFKAPVVTERREVIEQPVIVREGYIEHRRSGIDLPGVHIHW